MLFSSLFIIFLDERDGERFKYRSEKGINVSSFLTYIKKERLLAQISQKVSPNMTGKPYLCTVNKSQQVMNDLIKVNTLSENMALNKCQEILNDRREALASKAKKND